MFDKSGTTIEARACLTANVYRRSGGLAEAADLEAVTARAEIDRLVVEKKPDRYSARLPLGIVGR
jgi:hypothetical protein